MAFPVPQVSAPSHSGTDPAVLSPILAGATDGYSKANKTAESLETVTGLSCGCYAVLSGLAFSSTGLTLTVATGWAFIDAIVDVAAAINYTLPASSTSYIWLMQAGTLTHTATTTPPAGKALYLGKVVTSGSVVTSSDTYGLVQLLGGMAWRTTDDAGTPADSPGANLRIWTKCPGGLYIWTGAAHTRLDT